MHANRQPKTRKSEFLHRQKHSTTSKQGYTLKNWVEGLPDEPFFPWESRKKNRLKSVNPTFATEQNKVSI